jgi:hypothetical protein
VYDDPSFHLHFVPRTFHGTFVLILNGIGRRMPSPAGARQNFDHFGVIAKRQAAMKDSPAECRLVPETRTDNSVAAFGVWANLADFV